MDNADRKMPNPPPVRYYDFQEMVSVLEWAQIKFGRTHDLSLSQKDAASGHLYREVRRAYWYAAHEAQNKEQEYGPIDDLQDVIKGRRGGSSDELKKDLWSLLAEAVFNIDKRREHYRADFSWSDTLRIRQGALIKLICLLCQSPGFETLEELNRQLGARQVRCM
jgi:hypothetical protein